MHAAVTHTLSTAYAWLLLYSSCENKPASAGGGAGRRSARSCRTSSSVWPAPTASRKAMDACR